MEYQKDIFSSQVLATYDYDKFKLIKSNRRIDNNNLKRLIQSMKERDMKIPIVVTNDYKVIDGQHRLTARRQLQLHVYFIINNEAEGVIDDVILATIASKVLCNELRRQINKEDYFCYHHNYSNNCSGDYNFIFTL